MQPQPPTKPTDRPPERPCTSPQRLRMVDSIKRSIHRSIHKIDPSDYKNILKGENIFLHLCHKGEIINTEYTKVALFMGAVVFKRAVERITAVVTNDSDNKMVKKLKAMGRPVLSVLWLEACFQEKRKVAYEDFLFQADKNAEEEQENQEDYTELLEDLVESYQANVANLRKQFEQKYNHPKAIKFVDKRQKIDRNNPKLTIIPPREIDISVYLPQQGQKRKSAGNAARKKVDKKKVQSKSEGNAKALQKMRKKVRHSAKNQPKDKDNLSKCERTDGETQTQGQPQQEQQTESNSNSNMKMNNIKEQQQLRANLYEKYLKDFKKFEYIKQKYIEEMPLNIQEDGTPVFGGQQIFIQKKQQGQNVRENNKNSRQIPSKDKDPKTISQNDQQLLKTQSLKKLKPITPATTIINLTKNIRLNIIHPILSQKIQKINQIRQIHRLPLIQIAGNDSKNNICVISERSKIEGILALLSRPSVIINEHFITHMEKNPSQSITSSLLQKYQVKCKLNTAHISGKKIVLLDSVMGNSSLTRIIKECNASVLGAADFLFGNLKVDYVVTNKKMYVKPEKEEYRVVSEANFIGELITFQRKIQETV